MGPMLVGPMNLAIRAVFSLWLSKGSDNRRCYLCNIVSYWLVPLWWRHNGRDGVSNHQPHHCLLNHLFTHRSKKTSKLHVTGLCVGKSLGLVNSLHKWPVMQKMFSFDDIIMHCSVVDRKLAHTLKQLSGALTHRGLEMPYDMDLGQHWLRHCFITWTNVDISSEVFRGIHIIAISQEVLMNLICNMCSEITLLKLLPGTNELNPCPISVDVTLFHLANYMFS